MAVITQANLHFVYEKSTPGTHRYKEVSEGGGEKDRDEVAIGSLYLKKSAFGEKAPKKLEVSVKVT